MRKMSNNDKNLLREISEEGDSFREKENDEKYVRIYSNGDLFEWSKEKYPGCTHVAWIKDVKELK